MTAFYFAVALVAFIYGLSKGGLGGALGSIGLPILVLVMPAPVAVGVSLPLLLFGDVFAVWAHWRRWDQKLLLLALPGTLVGVAFGVVLLKQISALTLQHGLGIIAMLYVVYKLWEKGFRKRLSDEPITLPYWQTAIYTWGTGFASALANAGGPIFTIFLLTMRVIPSVFVGTSAIYYLILNGIKLPFYFGTDILSFERFFVVAWALPLVPMGVRTGVLLDRRINKQTFENIILVLLAITGVLLLAK